MDTVIVISVKFASACHPMTFALHDPSPTGFCRADPDMPKLIDIPGSLPTVLWDWHARTIWVRTVLCWCDKFYPHTYRPHIHIHTRTHRCRHRHRHRSVPGEKMKQG
jgi:hypothetical protein